LKGDRRAESLLVAPSVYSARVRMPNLQNNRHETDKFLQMGRFAGHVAG